MEGEYVCWSYEAQPGIGGGGVGGPVTESTPGVAEFSVQSQGGLDVMQPESDLGVMPPESDGGVVSQPSGDTLAQIEANLEAIGTDALAVPTAVGPIAAPSYCSTATGSKPKTERFKSCHKKSATANRILVTNGRVTVIGRGKMDMVALLYMSHNQASVIAQTSVRLVATTGNFGAPRISGKFWCNGRCNNVTSSFPTRSLPFATTLHAIGGATPNVAYGSSATLTVNWSFNLSWTTGVTTGSATATSLRARCDYAGAPGVVGRGCVVHDSAPALVYSRSGAYPTVATHIGKALASGLPSSLTRVTNSSTVAANRNKACPSTLVRPANMSCDEYPFASSYQGAVTGGGTVRVFSGCSLTTVAGSGSRGFSRCMVNANQNSGAGGVLGGFYKKQRVLDGDRFTVRIT